MAAATSLRGGSVDQRLPTRWTSPRHSKSCSRASALSLLRPAARAAIAVENEPGSLRSAALRRSGRSGPRPPVRCAAGASGSAVAGTGSNAGAGLRATGGSSPNRARQPPHKTTGSRSAGRTTANRRHPRPDRHTPQRRPACSISIRSSVRNGVLPHHGNVERAVAVSVPQRTMLTRARTLRHVATHRPALAMPRASGVCP